MSFDYKAYMRTYNAKRRNALKAKGICGCGRRRLKKGHSLCSRCLARHRENYHTRMYLEHARMRAAAWGKHEQAA